MEHRIIYGFPDPQEDFYKVYVRSITYNQASFIEDCLNGVAAQITSFPFVHHVIDDCSTDGEQNVIKEWMNKECEMNGVEYYDNDICTITLARYKNNPNNIIVVYFLKRNLYKEKNKKAELFAPWRVACTYEAICEGDDYWTDPNKLQKQVEWMDSHSDYSMCFSNAKLLNVNNLPCSFDAGRIEDREYLPDEFLKTWLVPTASVLYRREVNDVHLIKPERIMFGDIILILKTAKIGKVRGMSDIMTVYRLNNGSATQNPQYEYKYTMKRPEFVEFIIDNFGDILDLKYLYKGLCLRYCYRSLAQLTSEDKYNDLIKAANINKVITLKFVLRNFVFMGIRAMFKIILRR